MNRIKRLFYDIETSPNIGFFWRSGYKQNIGHDNIIHERAIICVCWKWEGSSTVHSIHWDKSQSDKKLLEKFVKEMQRADEMVAHNGNRFDLRWIRTRCLKHGIDLSPAVRGHDTLKIARSKYYFNSNRLDYLGKFLGVGGKMQTGGFDLWRNIVLNKCSKSMKKMVDYCKRDVILLEKVWDKLSPTVRPISRASEFRIQCPDCGSNANRNKKWTNATGVEMIELRCKNKTCNKYFSMTENIFQKSMKEMLIAGL